MSLTRTGFTSTFRKYLEMLFRHEGKTIMNRSLLTILLSMCVLLKLSPALAADSVIRVGGSGTCTGVMKHLASEFEKRNPGVRITMAPSLGSSGGIKALLGGSLDIALSARPLKDNEKTTGAATVFSGRSPFAFMVNKNVPLTGVTTKELESIYGLQKQSWQDGSAIRLILRPDGDSDTKIVQAISPELSQAYKSALSQPGMQIALTDQDSDKSIVRTPGAIGGTTLAQHLTDKLDGKLLAFNSFKPTLKGLKEGSYPLYKKQIVIVIPSKTNPATTKFISFINSQQAARIWEKYGVHPDGRN